MAPTACPRSSRCSDVTRLILKYGHPIPAIILVVFAWVVYQRISSGSEILPLAVTAVILWVLGAPAFIYFWPRITVGGFKRAIVEGGFSGTPIPVNTLYAEPAPPLHQRRTGA